MPFGVNPLTGKPGPQPAAGRDGDKKQARARVNQAVRRGELPRPNSLSCVDCGEPAAEYDHHLGYAAEHHLDVEPVCSRCHVGRDSPKKAQTSCIHGHDFTPENTIIKTNGTRACRACRQSHDRQRRGADHWRAYRAARKNNG